MPAANMPAAELDVTVALVEKLVAEQVPSLAGEAVTLLSNGWDNVLFRVGDELLARLPRREVAVPLIESEQRWLPQLAPLLPLPIPAPVHAGRPGLGYPWPWSLVRFIPGESALARLDRGEPLADAVVDAERLGAFFAALHRPAPDDAPPNPFRGIPLAARDERNQGYLDLLDDPDDIARLRHLWEAALDVPEWGGAPVWLHGDPHPGNMVLDTRGRLAAVIDFGDITGGDPATDVSAAWMLLPRDARPTFRAAVGVDDDTWARAFGWALSYGLVLLATSADNAPYQRLGARILTEVLGDDVL